MARWHAAMVNSDSVSGIPYKMPLDCDSCRRSIPLTQVDSLRRGRQSIGGQLAVVALLCLIPVGH